MSQDHGELLAELENCLTGHSRWVKRRWTKDAYGYRETSDGVLLLRVVGPEPGEVAPSVSVRRRVTTGTPPSEYLQALLERIDSKALLGLNPGSTPVRLRWYRGGVIAEQLLQPQQLCSKAVDQSHREVTFAAHMLGQFLADTFGGRPIFMRQEDGTFIRRRSVRTVSDAGDFDRSQAAGGASVPVVTEQQ